MNFKFGEICKNGFFITKIRDSKSGVITTIKNEAKKYNYKRLSTIKWMGFCFKNGFFSSKIREE